MNEKSKMILKKAGWYQGKKSDISEILKYYETENMEEIYRKHFKLEVFPKAKEFLEEFGDVVIKKDNHPYHIFNLKEVFPDEYCPYLSEEISMLLNQKSLVIGMCSGGMNIIYIVESGEIYDSYGYVAKNMYEMWDYILGTIAINESSSKNWEKLGLENRLSEIELEVFKKYEEQDVNK